MKRLLIAGSLALATAGQALAADLPPAAPPPPRAPAAYVPYTSPVYNWGGIYIGANVGGAFVNQGAPNNTVTSTGAAVGGVSTSSTGFAGGGQIGANFQLNQVVFGIEADADYLSNKSTVVGVDAATGASNQHVFTIPFFSTVRGRVGYAWDRVLVYGTAGLAMGEYQVQRTQVTTPAAGPTPITPAPMGTVENYSDLRLGWTAGGGIEYAMTDNFTARVEYLFADLESLTYSFPISNRTQAAPSEYVNLIRFGLNYKFGGF
jgi:outer membrane immunogenic protein